MSDELTTTGAQVAPAAIGGDFKPRGRSGVASAEVDGEVVLYDEGTGRIHLLNASAALIWACCDGSVTLDELAGELGQATAADPHQVRADVMALVGRLGRLGLLAGVWEESQDP